MEAELRQRGTPSKAALITELASSNGHAKDVKETEKAAREIQSSGDHFGAREIVLMALLSLQTGAQPLLIKYCVRKDIIITTQVMVCEFFKVVLAAGALALDGSLWRELKGWQPTESLMMAAIPGAIYAVQNSLIQMAYRHVDGVTFNLLNQTKLISTALCNYAFLQRKQSRQQLVALTLMLVAAVLLTTGPTDKASANQWTADTLTLGIIPLLLASMTSGVGSTYSQWVVQVRARSPHLFTMEMCSFSFTLLLLNTLTSAEGARMRDLGVFHAWTALAVIPPLTNALGGILVGLVTKYAGGVRKGFSVIFGLVIAAVLQFVFEGIPLSPRVLIALPMVVMSTYIHAQSPYAQRKAREE